MISAKDEMNVALSGGESKIKLGKDADIMAAFIRKDAEVKRAPMPPADRVVDILTAGDAKARDDVNLEATGALMALAQKKQEGKQKIWNGCLGVLTVVGTGVLTVMTGGATTPLFLAAKARRSRTQPIS